MATDYVANEYVTVVGIFTDPTNAHTAIERMRELNLAIDDISVVERDAGRYDAAHDYNDAEYGYTAYDADELGDETAGGLVLGSLVGGTLGTLAGLGALTIPGIGPVIAAGPLVGALVGGTAGAVTGTLAGALVETFEVPDDARGRLQPPPVGGEHDGRGPRGRGRRRPGAGADARRERGALRLAGTDGPGRSQLLLGLITR